MAGEDHYLKRELYDLVRSDSTIFEFLQAGSLDGVWYWDVENPREEWLSPRFKELFGYEDHEVPNTSEWWQANIHPDDLGVALENFEKHCEDVRHPYDQVVRYRHKDGSTVWVRCRGLAIRDDDGKPVRLLGCHQDITALKRAQAELELLNKELESFAYSVSHDLRQPLRSMDGFARALQQQGGDGLDETSHHYIERICAGAERMNGLIDGLLRLSRVTRTGLKRETTDLAKLATRVAEQLRSAAPQRTVEFDVEDRLVANADRHLADLLLQNLLANAWKFTSERPISRISVGHQRVNGEAVFYVRDNGVGFDERHADKLFGAFQRLHSPSEFPGLGIGLATAHRITRRHGGRIWAEGKVDEGATFYFSFGDA